MSATADREILAARDVLARYAATYDLDAEGPVPVEDIAESLCGLLVRDIPLDPGVSGMLLLRRCEIHVNALEAGLWPARRRFTIAHEIGHWELHRDEIDDVTVTRTADYEAPAAAARSP
ncbi:MAG: ImmA/IrrE family metallo-endopeptidase, partial [Gaiellales bacterium]